MLHQITLHAQPGEMVALVGATGAGKSTLVNLLTRFYEYDTGEIFIDGRPLRDFSKSALRGAIGMVTQESFLFNGTIRDNLRLGKPGRDRRGALGGAGCGERARVRRAPAGGPRTPSWASAG